MINPLYSYYPNYWDASYILNYLNNQSSGQQLSIYNVAQQAQSVNNWNMQQPSMMANTMTTFTNYANQLWQASTPLQADNSGNVFNQRVTTSSDSNAVTAQALTGATVATYNVGVTQVAAAQQNVGGALTSSATTGLAAGNYTFNLNVNNTNYAVSFNVNAGDTEQTVLNNMAQAINATGASVTASVSNDTTAGTSKLVIDANNTGTTNAFTLSDVTGNAVSYTGAGTTTTAATNASYSVNGVSYTSSSNSVYLDNGNVTLNLSGTTSNATVSVATDNQAISSAINNFVTAYNNLLNYVNANQQYINPEVAIDLSGAYNEQLPALEAAGITQNPDQTLAVNQTTLNNALQNDLGSVQAAFSGLGGLAVEVGSQSQQIASNPLNTFANSLATVNNNYYGIYNYLGALDKASLLSSLFPSGQSVNLLI